jgi:hemerythrin-like domain-containing protein
MNATPSSIALFEFLDKTHADIKAQLHIMRAVVSAIEADGLDLHTREQARRLVHYFNTEARQHHLDEEKHIFPGLHDSQVPEVAHAAETLRQDHGWLEENWIQIAPSLDAAANGNMWFDPQELHHAIDVFEALYLDHMMLEESLIYPEAKKQLGGYSAAGAGREMAQRRSKRFLSAID